VFSFVSTYLFLRQRPKRLAVWRSWLDGLLPSSPTLRSRPRLSWRTWFMPSSGSEENDAPLSTLAYVGWSGSGSVLRPTVHRGPTGGEGGRGDVDCGEGGSNGAG